MKRFIVAGVAFAVVLTACDVQEGPFGGSESGASVLPSQSVKLTEELSDAVQERLLSQIRIYENYSDGLSFSAPENMKLETMENYLLGWLCETGLIEQYAVYSGAEIAYYSIPSAHIEVFYTAVFGRADIDLPNGNIEYSAEQVLERSELLDIELDRIDERQDGGWDVYIRRYYGGLEWFPARYVLYLDEKTAFPPGKSSLSQQTISCRFYSVENLELTSDDKKPAQFVEIGTPEQLVEFAELVNSGDYDYLDNVYTLTADLDMQGIEFIPIGGGVIQDKRNPAPYGFCSTFDGRGNTIRNLTVANSDTPAGLFAVVGSQGFVNNLRLENCDISASMQEIDGAFSPAGGIAGIVHGGVISRCSISGKISAVQNAGGIAGVVSGNANVQKCSSSAQVSGVRQIGGAFGSAVSGRTDECTSTGSVQALSQSDITQYAIGGFVGLNEGAVIDRGISSAELRGGEAIDSFGIFAGENKGSLVGCFYNSDLLSDSISAVGISQSSMTRTDNLIGFTQAELEAMGAFS